MADVKVLKQAADFSKLKVIESLDDFPLWSTRLKAHLLTAGLWDEMKSQPTAGNDTTSLLLSITADHFLMPFMDQNLTALSFGLPSTLSTMSQTYPLRLPHSTNS